MLSWGMNVSALKVIVENFMPVTITSLRIFVASLTALLILAFSGLVCLPKKSEWLYIIGGAFLSVVFHHYFLSEGLLITSATNTWFILVLELLFILVFSMFFLIINPTVIQLIGFIFCSLVLFSVFWVLVLRFLSEVAVFILLICEI